jgi:hypothetical protein
MIKKALITFLIALCVPSFAEAEDSMVDGPCKEDRETLCKEVKPGHGHVMKCMHDNRDKVSAECKKHMESKKAQWKEKHQDMQHSMKEACMKDPECSAKMKNWKDKKQEK